MLKKNCCSFFIHKFVKHFKLDKKKKIISQEILIMKKIGFVLLTLALSINFMMAQQNKKQAGNANFVSTVHDFGKVAEEVGTVTCEFKFTNTSEKPLLVLDIRTSCGCTTPSYTKEPVLPGKQGTIKVSYSTTGRVGSFDKKITVFTNEPDNVYTLTIKGEVLPRK